jgi:hypothetical protein
MSDDLAAALALVESVRGDIRAGHAERTLLTALRDAAERLAGGRAEDRRARFSIRTSASVSLSWRASALSSLTSSEVASRAVSPASRFLPASRNSFDQR